MLCGLEVRRATLNKLHCTALRSGSQSQGQSATATHFAVQNPWGTPALLLSRGSFVHVCLCVCVCVCVCVCAETRLLAVHALLKDYKAIFEGQLSCYIHSSELNCCALVHCYALGIAMHFCNGNSRK
jgi:hypothetical protein